MDRQSSLSIDQELIDRLLQGHEITDPFTAAQQRKRARAAVIYAISAGILTRPSECSKCGETETERVGIFTAAGEPAIHRIEAHHEDYSKPLEVQWLCAKCHARADQARRLLNAAPPLGNQFAAFLLVAGEYILPFRYDPTGEALEGYYDSVVRAIRSVRFAGFKSKGQPCVWAKLSCNHELLWPASALAELATYSICHYCTDAAQTRRWERAERRRQRRRCL